MFGIKILIFYFGMSLAIHFYWFKKKKQQKNKKYKFSSHFTFYPYFVPLCVASIRNNYGTPDANLDLHILCQHHQLTHSFQISPFIFQCNKNLKLFQWHLRTYFPFKCYFAVLFALWREKIIPFSYYYLNNVKNVFFFFFNKLQFCLFCIFLSPFFCLFI